MGNAHARHHAPLLLKMAAFATTTPSLKAEFRGQTAGLKRVQPVKAAAVNTVTEAKVKVAINGFGRIGRNFLRCWHGRESSNLEVVAINDSGGVKQASHLVKYDSILGTFDAEVKIVDDTHMSIDGKSIEIVSSRDPLQLPWKKLGVQLVIEGTGVFIDTPGASKHIEAGAEKVIITAPAKGDDIPTYVMGVNETGYTHADKIIQTEKKCPAEEINAAFREAAEGPMKGILA